ncbi:MAG: hypothetical protein PHH36_12750 [Sideroxydans sp.]|nr:hypothetical protein [Sideroxydans sp.]
MDLKDIVIWIVLPIIIIMMIRAYLKSEVEKDKKFDQSLTNSGYKYIFKGWGETYIAFDIDNKRIKIGDRKTKFEKDISNSEILNYEWEWVENERSQRVRNKFCFTLRDPDYPLHEISYGLSGSWAEKDWAKLQSVLSSY